MNTTTPSTKTLLKGGEWLIKESNAFETFTPEDFNEEQLMVKEMCLQFLQSEVNPIVDRIDKMEAGLMPSLLVKAGEQGRKRQRRQPFPPTHGLRSLKPASKPATKTRRKGPSSLPLRL